MTFSVIFQVLVTLVLDFLFLEAHGPSIWIWLREAFVEHREEANLEVCQVHKMELFAKMVNERPSAVNYFRKKVSS